MNNKLLTFLQKTFNDSAKVLSKGQVQFYCKFCNHRKRKLEICLDENSSNYQNWHCWVCGKSGKTMKSLLYKLNYSKDFIYSNKELLGIKTKKRNKHFYSFFGSNKYQNTNEHLSLELPKEFKSLLEVSDTPEYRHALHHITKIRGLAKSDIRRYNIGYCTEGDYKNRIIVPSYDSNNRLNYFIARKIFAEDEITSYTNPKVDKQEIIFFENLVSWTHPIVLVEGVFDSMAIKRNSIPLLGKELSDLLKSKIIENNTPHVYICLDSDALKNSLKAIRYLVANGINTSFVPLNKKDPSEEGFESMLNKIKYNAREMNEYDILKMKMYV